MSLSARKPSRRWRVAGATAAGIIALAAGLAVEGASADNSTSDGDETPPTVKIAGLSTCVLSHGCYFYVESSEDGATVGEGRVLVSGSPGQLFRFRRVRRPVDAREEYELHFTLRRGARRAVARALRRGRRVTAKVKVTVTDTAGNRSVRRRTLPIVLR